jgi:hypothetical protein
MDSSLVLRQMIVETLVYDHWHCKARRSKRAVKGAMRNEWLTPPPMPDRNEISL